ncbi:MAG: response regulator [Flaviaesturariibacter sp.]|nr:response regulator [Flaviaesturariibacter sp.]
MADKKIMIIDDDRRNIFALKAVLKSRGYTVLSSIDALEGIAMLAGDPAIKVVLLDMMMPETDGYEALRLIRANAAIASTIVIAVTAQAMVGDREKCLAAGADNYLAKPVDIDALVPLLERYLN